MRPLRTPSGRLSRSVAAALLTGLVAGCGAHVGAEPAPPTTDRPESGATSTPSAHSGSPRPANPSSPSSSAHTSAPVASSPGPAPLAAPQDVSTDPLAAEPLWVDPASIAAVAGVRAAGTDAQLAAARAIAATPVADWFTGTATGPALTAQVRGLLGAAAAAGRLPVLVAYDIPHRDCGDYSRGGAADAQHYRAFVAALAAGLGTAPAAVVVEPDALSLLDDCGLGSSGETEREQLLAGAVATLAARPSTAVYLDAGSAGWHSAAETAGLLQAAGIGAARGFALNVANFKTDADSIAFGQAVTALTGKPFVVDTSRNGNGPWQVPQSQLPWCNPPGRALGHTPTADTGVTDLDAYLWIKSPGVSDGQCGRGDPAAGVWYPSYAASLVAGRSSDIRR